MKVLIPSALRSYTGAAQVPGAGDSLHGVLADLDRRFPGIRFRIVDERGQLRPNLRIFVDGQGVRDLGHPVRAGSVVAIVLALSGG